MMKVTTRQYVKGHVDQQTLVIGRDGRTKANQNFIYPSFPSTCPKQTADNPLPDDR
jgi:hypothetical protein